MAQQIRNSVATTEEPANLDDLGLAVAGRGRLRLGDPHAVLRQRRREAVRAAESVEMDRVVDQLIATDDSELQLMSVLRGPDARNDLVQEDPLPTNRDRLAGPFAHIVVDEAQEITDAEWQMLRVRCPSASFTIVGDRAQARHGFTESWQERLARVGFDRIRLAGLSVNYRTPREVMAAAEPVIRAARTQPDAAQPMPPQPVPVSRPRSTATWP